ncbi:DUF4834 family protein [Pedobacter ureilyticus]|jgi:flagellar basal body-associated protein FliL|uniref:DUF4834 family protein n=1 Tax=Pedobacter ureilyticus TaxID=1393051 RepID=A0ABW9J3L9_9SPHI|nr:DUF4834 family protein [Pedobacter helvus]
MGGVIKFLIIAIIVLWVIRLLVRMIFPAVIRNAFNNMQNQATGQQQQQRARRPEGTISIDYMPKKEKKKGNADNLGDFVDYEEVK